MQELQSKLIKALAFIHKKNEFSDTEFKDYYENTHAPLASSLLTFEGYERNYINTQLNPLYASLGSISIFKYQSMKSLEIIEEEMSSNKGDILRKDELNFMNVPQNYFVLSESKELTEEIFKKKIFCPLRKNNKPAILDSIDGVKKISDNIIMEPLEITSIPEYGITTNISLNTLEKIMQDLPEIILASSIR
tara:strand:+ start:3598 stop:4173 length:576 start_codon:yes stop_codon:yes gene_type:complete